MFDILEKAVEKGQDLGASYVELRGESGFIEYIQMDDLRVNALTQRIEQGVAVRVLADGAWGFVSTGDLGSLDDAVENAYKMAKAAAPTRREPIRLSDHKSVRDAEEIKVVRDPCHVPIEEKIGYMESMTKVIKGYDPRITAVTVKVRSASGNARAESYLHPPIIRMRSTFFETGDWSHDELFEGIDFGYYCLDMRGGQAQMNASFQVGIQEAYEIVDGEIGKPVTDLSISGIATDSLFKIEGISKDEFTFGAGRCGKGQEAFISDGGPNTRFLEGGITFGGQG